MRLENKVVLITGAGSGMGKVASNLFAKEGAKILAFDYNPTYLEATVKEVTENGGKIHPVQGDVSKSSDVQKAISEATETFGGLHVLYNNAGIFPDEDASVEETPEDVYQRVMDVNLKGVFLCCKYGIPAIIDSGGGSIVNIASFVALVGCTIPQDAYTASKGAVLSLTRSLAVQYGPKGVRANAICPGPIETPLTAQILNTPEKRALRLNRIPLGRFGKPEDIVYAALFLASNESSWVNGTSFVVDGGISVNYF